MKRVSWMAFAVIACRPGAPAGPQVAEKFYAELRASRVTGAPTPEQLSRLAPYLGDSLQKLLVEARRQHDADLARAPGEKPSFAEGDLFSSLFEGPTSVTIEAASDETEIQKVLARMTHDSTAPATSWTDTLLMGNQGGHPVIEDIRYGGNWDFALKGTLRAQLSGARAAVQ